MHSVDETHAVRHPSASQRYGAQSVPPNDVPSLEHVAASHTQTPPPSHVPVPSGHEPSLQASPVARTAQAPAPSHTPVSPQPTSFSQLPWGSTVPASTGSQTPSLPPPFAAAVHAKQGSPQSVSQHVPETQ